MPGVEAAATIVDAPELDADEVRPTVVVEVDVGRRDVDVERRGAERDVDQPDLDVARARRRSASGAISSSGASSRAARDQRVRLLAGERDLDAAPGRSRLPVSASAERRPRVLELDVVGAPSKPRSRPARCVALVMSTSRAARASGWRSARAPRRREVVDRADLAAGEHERRGGGGDDAGGGG